jgi:hypothetical protein
LLVGSLKFGFVERLDLDGDKVIGSERLFEAEIPRPRARRRYWP